MEEPLASRVAAVAALDEPTRRRLYLYVAQQPAAVSRDDAAEAVGLARTTAAFHLDRLVEEGLLEVTFERRTGRTGPGAGRPAKLYTRSSRHVGVSIPERRYDLAGELLASAMSEAERTGDSPRSALERLSYDAGRQMGETGGSPESSGGISSDDALLEILRTHGFEPRRTDGDVILGNCPFHSLAQRHTELVCGMNLALVTGVVAGSADTRFAAQLEPAPGRCCVRLVPRHSA